MKTFNILSKQVLRVKPRALRNEMEEVIMKQDILDRIQEMVERSINTPPSPEFREDHYAYAEGYQDGLRDLADFVSGWCGPTSKLLPVVRNDA